MALLFCDSCDTGSIGGKWTTIGQTPSYSPGRHGNCIGHGPFGPTKTVTAVPSIVMGMAYKCSAYANNAGIIISDGGGNFSCGPGHISDGRLNFNTANPGYTSAPSTFVMNLYTWYYIECKVTLGPALITYEVRINGDAVTPILAGSFSAPALHSTTMNVVGLTGAGGGNVSYSDDIYVTDGEFLGDVAIYPLFPRLDGTVLTWVPSLAGTHFSLVNEHAPDTTTTVSCPSSALGSIDQYYLDQITGFTGTIKGTQLCLYSEKSDAGEASVQAVYQSGGGSVVTMPPGLPNFHPSQGAWIYMLDAERKSVFTGSDWTPTEINASQFGVKRIT